MTEVMIVFWRWLVIFSFLSLGYIPLFLLNFWQIKHGAEREIFGLTFSSYWNFLAFYILVISPLILAANYFFFSAYYLAYRVWVDIFACRVWVVHLTNSAATISVLLFLTWRYFCEVPTKGTLAGLILSIAAVLVSVFWK